MNSCLKLLRNYEWLINSFVLDFFHENHWETLPRCWQEFLADLRPGELAEWLDTDYSAPKASSKPWPLSLLALKQSINHLSLNRSPVRDLSHVARYLNERTHTEESNRNDNDQDDINDNVPDRWQFDPELMSGSSKHHQSLKHVFRKHVKPKKQYELCRLGKLASVVAGSLDLNKVLDIGSGVGHLSRYLCYNHKLSVACVDGDNSLTVSARKFDEELEKTVEKMSRWTVNRAEIELPPAPVHVTAHVSPDMNLNTFHALLRDSFSLHEASLQYGLVGLHTCGDLASVLVRMFTMDPSSLMINSLGCCYMKIIQHWPMSRHVTNTPWHALNYTSTELACHAIEVYVERLRLKAEDERDKLKVHCYRAVLEKLLIKRGDQYRHTILKTVPKSHLLPFPDYVKRATVNLVREAGLEPFSDEELDNDEVNEELRQWWKVVIFYSLRLAFAPVIGKMINLNVIHTISFIFLLETVILLDRCLFLLENDCDSIMFPLFDPLLSPRNQVIVAVKKS